MYKIRLVGMLMINAINAGWLMMVDMLKTRKRKKKWAAYLGLWSLGFSRRREWLYLGTTLCLGSKSTPRGSLQSPGHPGEIIKVQ